jgi:hypothetical protein
MGGMEKDVICELNHLLMGQCRFAYLRSPGEFWVFFGFPEDWGNVEVKSIGERRGDGGVYNLQLMIVHNLPV